MSMGSLSSSNIVFSFFLQWLERFFSLKSFTCLVILYYLKLLWKVLFPWFFFILSFVYRKATDFFFWVNLVSGHFAESDDILASSFPIFNLFHCSTWNSKYYIEQVLLLILVELLWVSLYSIWFGYRFAVNCLYYV